MQSEKVNKAISPIKAYIAPPTPFSKNNNSTESSPNPNTGKPIKGGFWVEVSSWKPTGIYTKAGFYSREWIRKIKIFGQTDRYCVPGVDSFIQRFWFLVKYTVPTVYSLGKSVVDKMRKKAKEWNLKYSNFYKKNANTSAPLDPMIRCAAAAIKRNVTHFLQIASRQQLHDGTPNSLAGKENVKCENVESSDEESDNIDKKIALARMLAKEEETTPQQFMRFTLSELKKKWKAISTEPESKKVITPRNPPVTRPAYNHDLVRNPRIIFCMIVDTPRARQYKQMLINTNGIAWSPEIEKEQRKGFFQHVVNTDDYLFEHKKSFDELADYLGIGNYAVHFKLKNELMIKEFEQREHTDASIARRVQGRLVNKDVRTAYNDVQNQLDTILKRVGGNKDKEVPILRKELASLKKLVAEQYKL
jgi:L-rhamnose mutarotase